MSKRLLTRGSRCEDVTQRKLDLGPRTQTQMSVEEQSLESRKRANAIQKKTYSNWISKVHHLDIEDLYTDLRDGKLLIQLLEVVSGEKIAVPTSKGNMPQMEKFSSLERIRKALDFLQQHNVRLENIRPSDIEEGREKETLALIWAIIFHYQIVVMPEQEPDPTEPSLGSNNHMQALVTDFEEKTISQVPVTAYQEKTATKTLLHWCQKTTQGYSGVKVTDFTNSWKDGLAFNAIIHKHRSDLIDFESLEAKNVTDNLNNAFDVAEKQLGIPKLLDTEDMLFPDERSVVVYISLFYSFFCLNHPEQPPSPVVPVIVPTPDPPHVERAQLQESGNETQASTVLGTQSAPVISISAPNPDPPNMERTQNQQLASKPQSANRIQSQASTGTGTLGTQTSQPSTMPAPSAPPYPPPKYTPYPTYQQPYQQPYYQQPYQQPYYQQPYQQPYYQQPYQQPYYQQPYQQQPYRPEYYQQPPYAAPPMQMMQQQTIQVQTGLGMLTVGAQQGAGGMQSSFMKLGSTTVGAAPPAKPTAYTPIKPTAYQPTKPTAYAPTKNKGKKLKK